MTINIDKQYLFLWTIILLTFPLSISSYIEIPTSNVNSYNDPYAHGHINPSIIVHGPPFGPEQYSENQHGGKPYFEHQDNNNHAIDSYNNLVVVNPFPEENYLKEGGSSNEHILTQGPRWEIVQSTNDHMLDPVPRHEIFQPNNEHMLNREQRHGILPINEHPIASDYGDTTANEYSLPSNMVNFNEGTTSNEEPTLIPILGFIQAPINHNTHSAVPEVLTYDQLLESPMEEHTFDSSVKAGHSDQTLNEYDQSPMSNAARILMQGHNKYATSTHKYKPHHQQPVSHNPYGYKDLGMMKNTEMTERKGYHMDNYHKHKDDHHYDDNVYHDDEHDDDHYPKKKKKKKYYKPKKKKKPKKVYVPIVIKKKKKKKRKTIAVYKGFYIQGGMQIFGKFNKIKDCKKACEITPNCFSADYNPWLKKCYIHTNVTACGNMRTHPKLIHFKKVPCDLLESPRKLILLGARIHGGLEQKGVKNLQDCIKRCVTAGQGISKNSAMTELAKQICFGIDYDFASHKCYFHTDMLLCPAVPLIPVPSRTVPAPSNILILLCPLSMATV